MNTKIPHNIICRLDKPSSYLGNEINTVQKDITTAQIKFALVFPDHYEISMSNLGIKILYKILNNYDFIAAERVFMPGEDYEGFIKNKNEPLCSLESHYPVNRFDVIGFSMQYEMSYTSVLHILFMASIPFYSKDRDEEHPLVIGGGPSAYNPEPVADFFDLLVIGDGEEVLIELLKTYDSLRKRGVKKKEILNRLSEINGIYVPSLFDAKYDEEGKFLCITSLKTGYTDVKKRIYNDINKTNHLISPIVPFAAPVHDRLTVEIDRGCTQGCRFCQAGYIYRPLREKENKTIETLIDSGLKNTGHDEVSLASLNIGMHKGIDRLIVSLMRKFRKETVALSLPSIRPDSIKQETIKEMAKVRKTGFTLVPEAGSQRLRNIINKDLDEQTILNAVKNILSCGWDNIKLYFMLGLPGENMDDVESIYKLCKEIKKNVAAHKLRLKNITVSVSCFVPKAHTPFQYCPQDTKEMMNEKQNRLIHLFKNERKMSLKLHNIELSFIEAVFARGDRRLSKVIETAYLSGCKLDGWSEHFNNKKWIEAFNKAEIDPAFYANQTFLPDYPLPWGHIKCGVSSKFMQEDYKNALKGNGTNDCRHGVCNNCGMGCPPPDRTTKEVSSSEQIKTLREGTPYKYRVEYTKKDGLKFLAHLELSRTIYRACRRAGLQLDFSKGYHPHPKISFDAALPVGIESDSEFMTISLTSYIKPLTMQNILNKTLPDGIKIISANDITGKPKTKKDKDKRLSYIILLHERYLPVEITKNRENQNNYIATFLKDDRITILKKGRFLDIRPLINTIECTDISKGFIGLNIILNIEESGKIVSPFKVLQKLYSIKEDNFEVFIKKTG